MANELNNTFCALPNNFQDKKGISVLVVDDEPKIQHLIGKYLERAKYNDKRLVFAGDGKEAMMKLTNQEFGLIIIDIVMPNKNGLQVIKELKEKAKTKNIPVLLISGNLHTEIVKQAIIMGVKNILAKPFNYDLFMDRVKETLEAAEAA